LDNKRENFGKRQSPHEFAKKKGGKRMGNSGEPHEPIEANPVEVEAGGGTDEHKFMKKISSSILARRRKIGGKYILRVVRHGKNTKKKPKRPFAR